MTDETSAQATVLVVDDQPQNIRLLDAILSPRGYDVRTAASGEEALAALDGADADIDLVLLDIVMPGHGRLRGVPAHPRADRDGIPAGRDGDRQRRTSRRSRPSRQEPTTS